MTNKSFGAFEIINFQIIILEHKLYVNDDFI